LNSSVYFGHCILAYYGMALPSYAYLPMLSLEEALCNLSILYEIYGLDASKSKFGSILVWSFLNMSDIGVETGLQCRGLVC
jgi:hypothetical protein